MEWTGTFLRNSTDMFTGVQGYFGTQDLQLGLQGSPPELISSTPTQVVFRSPILLGEIRFNGAGLAVETVTLPGRLGDFPKLSAGTITSFDVQFNPRLDDLLNTFIDPPNPVAERDLDRQRLAAQTLDNLVPNATVAVPNISAAALGDAIVQSYVAGNIGPARAFFNQFNHVYTGTDAPSRLEGFDNDDVLIGNGGTDNIFGNGGNDTLDGGAGSDGLNGGEGSDLYLPGPPGDIVGDSVSDAGRTPGDIDTVSYLNSTGPVVIDLNPLDGDQGAGDARGLVIGGIEAAIGSNFDDVIHGNNTPGSEADTLFGAGGNDLLLGYDGSDRLQGGPGFDTLVGGGDGGVFGGGPGDVAAFAAAPQDVQIFDMRDGGVAVAAPGGGVDLLYAIEFLDLGGTIVPLPQAPRSAAALAFAPQGGGRLDGGGGPDFLVGSPAADLLAAGAGADTLDAGDGDDSLIGGPGPDLLQGGPGIDRVSYVDAAEGVTVDLKKPGRNAGDAAGDRIAEVEILSGSQNRDRLFGSGQDDTLLGNGGNDALTGRGGDDSAEGGAGRDRLLGKGGADRLDGGEDDDRLAGQGGADVLLGGAGDDELSGGAKPDRLEGGPGADTLSGGTGADTLAGGDGDDVLSGGKKADTFVFSPGRDAGTDVITDFSPRQDTVEIDGGRFDIAVEDGDTIVTLSRGGTIVFEDAARLAAIEAAIDVV